MEKSEFHSYINEICCKFSHLRNDSDQKKPRGKTVKSKGIKKSAKSTKNSKIPSSPTSMTRIPSYSEMM